MAADPKDVARIFTDVHARVDEQDARLEKVEKAISPEVVTALVHGAVSALGAATDAKLDKLLAAQREDIQSDRELVVVIRELIEVLKMPTTRTSHVQLPSGAMTLITDERRN